MGEMAAAITSYAFYSVFLVSLMSCLESGCVSVCPEDACLSVLETYQQNPHSFATDVPKIVKSFQFRSFFKHIVF